MTEARNIFAALVASALALYACTGPNPAYWPMVGGPGAELDGAVVDPGGGGLNPQVMAGDPSGGSGGTAGAPSSADAGPGAGSPGGSGAEISPDAPMADSASGPGGPSPGPLANGLRIHWTFDEGGGTDVVDRSGNLNHASLSGQPAFAASGVAGAVPGNFALRFDASDDLLTLTTGRNLPPLEAPKTVALWLSPTNSDVRGYVTVLVLQNGPGTAIHLGYYGAVPAVWNVGASRPFLTGRKPPNPGWHHVTYTFDGNVHRIHVSAETPVETADTPPAGAVTRVMVGASQVGPEMYAGQIDDLRVYDRLLDAAEIAQLEQGF